jgi:hypothetical protein
MRLSSSDLYELVKTLSPSERRYLKIQAGRENGKHLILLDILWGMRVYDDSELIQIAEKRGIARSTLAVLKQYLYQYLLLQLEDYHREKLMGEGRELLHQARILWHKGLPGQCRKRVIKGKKQAQAEQLYPVLLEFLHLEKQLGVQGITAQKALYQEEKDCLYQLELTNESWWLLRQIANVQLEYQSLGEKEREEWGKKIKAHPLLTVKAEGWNVQARIYQLQALAAFSFTLRDPARALEANSRLLELLESHPLHRDRLPERYLSSLNNYLIDSVLLGKEEQVESGLLRLQAIPGQAAFREIPNIEARIFRQRFLLELNWLLRLGRKRQAVRLIPELERGLKKYGQQIQLPHWITLQYLLAYLFFLNKSFDSALLSLNELLQMKQPDVVKEVYRYARILNLLIHYELGNLEYLLSLLKTTRRRLDAEQSLSPLEKALFATLGQLARAPGRREQQEILFSFGKELEDMKEKGEKLPLLDYIDLGVNWKLTSD